MDVTEEAGGASGLPRPSPVEWVCLALGLFLTVHYAWFLDDAFVYFRYADNALFLGFGLVYNAGEYVEGFSSPLWMLLLLALRSTGLNFWLLTRLLGLVSYAAFWWGLVLVNRRASPAGSPVVNLPLCYLAPNYAVASYFTSGVEAPLVQVAGVLYALFLLRPSSRTLRILVAATPLLRHELALPFLVCLAFLWYRERRPPLGMAAWGIALTGGWVAFRVCYYADLFPVTFYLKDTVDLAQGMAYLADTALPYLLPVYLLGAGLCLLVARGRGAAGLAAAPRAWMVLLAVLVGAYVVKIGGDPRHYRYLAFPFVLLCASTAGAAEHLLTSSSLRRPRLVAAVLGLAVAAGSATLYPRQLDSHPALGVPRHRMSRDLINDASVYRHDPSLRHPPWGLGSEMEQRPRYEGFLEGRSKGVYLDVFTHAWCAFVYENFQYRCIHNAGLTDPFLARTRMKATRPAHKPGLIRLALQMVPIVGAAEEPGPGMFRTAVERGTAPAWVRENLDSIELIERKAYNRHDLFENLRLAFTFPGPIEPGPSGSGPREGD